MFTWPITIVDFSWKTNFCILFSLLAEIMQERYQHNLHQKFWLDNSINCQTSDLQFGIVKYSHAQYTIFWLYNTKTIKHSVETILWILTYFPALQMRYNTLPWCWAVAEGSFQSAIRSQGETNTTVHCTELLSYDDQQICCIKCIWILTLLSTHNWFIRCITLLQVEEQNIILPPILQTIAVLSCTFTHIIKCT